MRRGAEPKRGTLAANILDCARPWPGISAREIAEELDHPVQPVRQAMSRLRSLRLLPRPSRLTRRDAAMIEVACPACGIQAGARWRTITGHTCYNWVHAARLRVTP